MLMSVCMTNIVIQNFIVHNMFIKILTETGLLQHCLLLSCCIAYWWKNTLTKRASDEISEYNFFLPCLDNANVKVIAEH